MVDTFEAVAVAGLALLPGALYVWGFERQMGNWGIGLSDRLFRFFGTSALIHAAFAPLTYWLWGRHMTNGDIAAGRPLSLWVWAAVIAYVLVPFVAGTAVGLGTRYGQPWATLFTGPNPAPRAWDHFFGSRPDGWIRLRLKTGSWVGGVYGPSEEGLPSYAAGYPEIQDLFMAETVEVDAESGEFILDGGEPIFRGTSLLIRWDEVQFLEFGDG